MKKKQWICLVILAAFMMPLVAGCSGDKNVVQSNEKTGLSPEERKSKRGE